MNDPGTVRVRAAVDRWFGAAIVASLLVAAVGGVVAYGAYVDPGTHQEQRVVDEWGVNASFTHGAVVTEAANGTPFQPGETVRDREVYFRGVMPVLAGEFAFATRGTTEPVNLTIDRQLVVRDVERAVGDGEPTVYWQETRRLGTNRTTHRPDSRTTVPFRVNVSRTVAEAENASDRLDSPGQVRAELLVTVQATRRTDDAEPRRLLYSLTIDPDAGIYRVAADPGAETFAETETVAVRNEPGAAQRVGGPLALAAGLLGVVGLGLARWRGVLALTGAEREWVAYRDDRTDFDEWITTVRLPEEARDLPVARAETLADLVDLAIDTDSAVMETPGGDAYHVIHDGYRYTFEAPADPRDGAPLSLDDATASDDGTVPTTDGGGESTEQSGE